MKFRIEMTNKEALRGSMLAWAFLSLLYVPLFLYALSPASPLSPLLCLPVSLSLSLSLCLIFLSQLSLSLCLNSLSKTRALSLARSLAWTPSLALFLGKL
jgi:hypothetical protein